MNAIQIIPKQTLKTRTNINILRVEELVAGKYDYNVVNMKTRISYGVRFSKKYGTLVCYCMFGTQEISSEKIDESHRCKHIKAVRSYLERIERRNVISAAQTKD